MAPDSLTTTRRFLAPCRSATITACAGLARTVALAVASTHSFHRSCASTLSHRDTCTARWRDRPPEPRIGGRSHHAVAWCTSTPGSGLHVMGWSIGHTGRQPSEGERLRPQSADTRGDRQAHFGRHVASIIRVDQALSGPKGLVTSITRTTRARWRLAGRAADAMVLSQPNPHRSICMCAREMLTRLRASSGAWRYRWARRNRA
jgi:hypothetical protein